MLQLKPDKTFPRRFVSLRWKVFFHLSLLILALTATFGVLNYLALRQQFDEQLALRFAIIEQEMHGLMQRSTDRLQRLGAMVAMLVELSPALKPSPESLARLTALSYELDLKYVELFDRQGQLFWRWPEDQAQDKLPLITQVLAQETPLTLLRCDQECELCTLVPLLAAGRNTGVVSLAQTVADLILDFRAVTGANVEIGIFVPNSKGQLLWERPQALTNQTALTPLLGHLAKRYPTLKALENRVSISFGKSIYILYPIPLRKLIEGAEGWIILFTDVSEAFASIRQQTLNTSLATGSLAVAGELLLLLLIRTPTKRLSRLADTLPLLALGKYQEARAALAARKKRKLCDEIDVLETTAITLSHQLESQARTLALKNRELADERDFIRGLINAAHVIILTQTPVGIIQTVNEHGVHLLGFAHSELSGKPFTSLLYHPNAAEEFLNWLSCPKPNLRLQHESEIRCSDGTLRNIVWVHTRLKETRSHIAVLSVGLDVTDRVRAEAKLAWLATHDPLTGLFNRHRFQEELERTLAEVGRSRRSCALVLFDLDHFKDINDSSGHAAGDALLKLLAKLLKERVRSSDAVARLGGDEFAVLLADTNVSGAEIFARELNARLKDTPFHYAGKTYRLSASIGIAMLPEHGDNLEDLLANADLAMYQAKQAGRGRYHIFSFADQAREDVGQRVYWKAVITQALEARRFVFHYQPVVDTDEGTIVYHEALLRLVQEDGTLVLPGTFLTAAQRCGLMPAIDRFVVEEALRILREAKNPKIRLALNLSAGALTDAGWMESLQAEAKAGWLDPNQILFEVTETAAVTDVTAARQVMDALAQLGFRFAIDDFGAGFASFHYLKQLPFAYVKIDKSFVSELTCEARDCAFIRAIVTLAHGYGQKVIAEGVEDAGTLNLLRELKVDCVQGFYLYRPSPVLSPVAKAKA